ncbi:MAG: XisI protein [Caldilineaceae bacterium]
MDQVTTVSTHRAVVQELLNRYLHERPIDPNVETQLIADLAQDHYQLVNVGWEGEHRVYGCVIHIDIKGDKIWIQHNMTENLVAEDLVALGVPKEQIVLGLHSPFKRRFTEFALN